MIHCHDLYNASIFIRWTYDAFHVLKSRSLSQFPSVDSPGLFSQYLALDVMFLFSIFTVSWSWVYFSPSSLRLERKRLLPTQSSPCGMSSPATSKTCGRERTRFFCRRGEEILLFSFFHFVPSQSTYTWKHFGLPPSVSWRGERGFCLVAVCGLRDCDFRVVWKNFSLLDL